jgi:Protein of unknown function (DUF3999)
MKQVFSLSVLLFVCAFASGQGKEFKYCAAIQKIDSSGVYKIELQPGFIAKGSGLYDIRVMDETGKFVAYTIVTNPSDKLKPVFIDFPEVKQVAGTDTATVYIAENKNRNKIDQLWLRLKNMAVSRTASLSGSDDLQHWFAIEEDIQLQDATSGGDTEYEQMLSFPQSNYRYFRIHISNKNKDLINILRSGIYISDYAGYETPFKLTPLPPVKLSMKNNAKQTSYLISMDDKYTVDELHIEISSPKYYNRRISVYNVSNKTEQHLVDDILSSSGQGYVNISAKTNKLRIDIINGDDKPLVIKNITALYLNQFAVSYLEKGHKYSLLVGDSAASEVSYDLTFLHSKPMSQFPVISHSQVENNPAYGKLVFKVSKDYTQLIWISIAIVLILLSLLTWRMVKELNAKQ